MKRSSLKIKTIAVALAMGMILSASACGEKKEEETTTSEETTTETTPMVTVPTTEATTTLMEYGSTLAPNDQSVSWTEESSTLHRLMLSQSSRADSSSSAT